MITKETKYLEHLDKVTFQGVSGIICKGIYKEEKQQRWFFFSDSKSLDGAKPKDWDILSYKTGKKYSYAIGIVGQELLPEAVIIDDGIKMLRQNTPSSETFNIGDSVALVNPNAASYKYGSIEMVKQRYAAIGVDQKNWKAIVTYVADYVRVRFLNIDSGYYKFDASELKKVSLEPIIDTSGSKNIVVGHSHVAEGTYTNSFVATPSGYVETLNDDMPLFKRVTVQPNKIPDFLE